ncbi:Apolipoprotein N-acyltransferase [Richelia intracellularis HH01]|uniref:Apolipoprotein N-acyltransferase n=1 Tax=Richelia intracellularis HH01 TaxID=1165094 RepID=M1WZ27_9NOST|nr:apolipoprotein N-acyltransferase [Richelia intracellularis]CCH67202.1 Apolipoprotein N-acyltransferase [Richelia intracellularis HH01]HAE06594.1 apolipoprotein N-acyltransferase [Richelia sp.]
MKLSTIPHKILPSNVSKAFLSGVLMGMTVAPVGAWFLAWFALVPLWLMIFDKEPKRKLYFHISLVSIAWGIGYHGTSLSWITSIHPMTWMKVSWLASLGISLFCWVFITFWGAILLLPWGIGLFLLTSKLNSLSRVLVGTALWCGLEAIWSYGPLWWSSLSYTQSPNNLIVLHIGQISGPNTVTAAIVAVNGLIAEAYKANRARESYILEMELKLRTIVQFQYYLLPLTLFLMVHIIGWSLYKVPLNQTAETALKVGIIQGNIPNTIKLYPEGLYKAITGYTMGYINLVKQGVNVVLTPEGALPFFEERIMASPLVAAVKDKGVVAWIGGFAPYQDSEYTNSVFTVTREGEVFSRYDKVKLVPLGEYVPFKEILGTAISRLSPLKANQVHGLETQVFDTPFGRAIIAICYESAFSERFRYQASVGGQFILSSSNDAHYSAAMPAQHHALDIMRAIENDRWAVRATNTGYSAFVNPHGRTLWISGHNTYEIKAETIYKRQTQTLYVRWGDWLTSVLLVLGGSMLIVEILHKHKVK